jgi:hypothetical protein
MADAGVSLPGHIPQPHKEHRQCPATSHWLALAVAAGFLAVASVEVRLHTRVPATSPGRRPWSTAPNRLCGLPRAVVVRVRDERNSCGIRRSATTTRSACLEPIADATRAAALRLVRSGRLYDLGRVLDADVPAFRRALGPPDAGHHRPSPERRGLGADGVNWITELGVVEVRVAGRWAAGEQSDPA